jgi:hypothetical protein
LFKGQDTSLRAHVHYYLASLDHPESEEEHTVAGARMQVIRGDDEAGLDLAEVSPLQENMRDRMQGGLLWTR